MRKHKIKLIPVLCAVLLSCASFTGCSSKEDDKLLALEEKMTQIEDAIAELQAQKEEKETRTVNTSQAESKTAASLEGLTASVDRMKENIKAVVPAGTKEERMSQYFDMKNEIKQLVERIDAYDDNLEIQYKNNTLSYTDYCIQERMAEDLKVQLSDSETSLKQLLRVESQTDEAGE